MIFMPWARSEEKAHGIPPSGTVATLAGTEYSHRKMA